MPPFPVYEVMVELSSLMLNALRPPGWNAKWRGPAPGAVPADCCGAGLRAPLVGSKVVDEHLVESEVYGNQMVIVSAEDHVMSVRAFLTFLVGPLPRVRRSAIDG